jgi:putative transposase
MSQSYQHGNTCVYLLNYHLVWCPKRRRKILVGALEARLSQLLEETCQDHGWRILAKEIMPDHLHLFLSADPKTSVVQIIHQLKGYTSRVLRQEFPFLQKMPSMWTRSFFVSTAGNASAQTILKYIEEQKTREE